MQYSSFQSFQDKYSSLAGFEEVDTPGQTLHHLLLRVLADQPQVGHQHLSQQIASGVQGGGHDQILDMKF